MRISDWSSDVCSSDLATIGGGAVAGALALPAIRKRIDADRLVAAGTLITAAAMALLGLATGPAMALPAAVLGGLGWITVLTSRSEEHTSELQSLMRISYAVFCLKQQPHTLRPTRLL